MQSDNHSAQVHRMKPISILCGINRFYYPVLGDMSGEWKLYDKTVNIAVSIEICYLVEKNLFRDIFLKSYEC